MVWRWLSNIASNAWTEPEGATQEGLTLWQRYQFIPTPGALPHSVNLNGAAFRYQRAEHFYTGEDFWRTFEEGPWKWTQHQRFAAKEITIGHYFGFSPVVVLRELQHYCSVEEQKNYKLIEIRGSVDNILDLTNVGALSFAREKLNIMSEDLDVDLLVGLMNHGNGGGWHTNALGQFADRNGYNGILFPSVRGFLHGRSQGSKESFYSGPNKNLFKIEYSEIFQNAFNFCFVIFSGAKLVSVIQEYRVRYDPLINPSARGSDWFTNPYYGANPDKMSFFDERGRREKMFRARSQFAGSTDGQ
jgi:hypothetical protein